jgi:glycosyltransferase involved in cell wall biosynthesis
LRILFITWDGPGLTYLENLFVPIFSGLAQLGHRFDVLQFRWGDLAGRDHAAAACARAGVGYRSVPVWRLAGPAGPFASAVRGGSQVRRAIRDFGSDAIMPRSLMPALATLAAGPGRLPPIIYDGDGLEADERAEFAGLSVTGRSYRLLRDVEGQILRQARTVLVRTPAARDILIAREGPPGDPAKYFEVTNGRVANLFHPSDAAARATVRAELGIAADAPLIVYAGSVGYRYNSPRIAEFAAAVQRRRPDARLLVLSSSPDDARREIGPQLNLLGPAATVMRAAPNDVARYLAAGDIGTAYVRPSFSTKGVSPIKISEYLLCGLPLVGAAEVGATPEILAAGMMLDDSLGREAAADWFVNDVLPQRERFRTAARALGLARFSLERSVKDYATALDAFAA